MVNAALKSLLDTIKIFDPLRRRRNVLKQKRQLKKEIEAVEGPLKVILGSGKTEFAGWIATDYPFFDITNPKDWRYFFNSKNPDNLLAEHVLEHLSEDQVAKVLKLAYQYLNPGGCFRIAVPDKNHPNPQYIEFVRPGGSGVGAHDHKSFWDYKSLSKVCQEYNFTPKLLEYYDKEGNFHRFELNKKNGIIKRTGVNNQQHPKGFHRSSLIIDALKK
jgi:predicted SAM-dependent methyltransferase